MPDGIDVRHLRACSLSNGGRRCTCAPRFRARVWVPYERRHVVRTFPTRAAARTFLVDARRGVELRAMSAGGGATLGEAADLLLVDMASGAARTRSGHPYKPSAVRSYRGAFDRHVRPSLGARRIDTIRRADLQALVDRLAGAGRSPSTIRNALMPVRVLYRRAVRDGLVVGSPLDHLDLPADRGRRDRSAGPAEVVALLDAVAEEDRVVWALALLAGLRRGELLALRVEDVDLEAGLINVRRSWDPVARVFVGTKSAAGERRVPLSDRLRAVLVAHLVRTGRRAGLLLAHPEDDARPIDERGHVRRARAAWRAAGLEPLGLHDARHVFVSLLIATGCDLKAVQVMAGHATIGVTLDRYAHLLPGAEADAAARLDNLLRGEGLGR